MRKHSEETKRKIAQGNTGQIFSESRCKAISEANQFKPSNELLQKLNKLWNLRYLNPLVIMELTGLKSRVYTRLFNEHCNVEQFKFMPSNWSPSDFEIMFKLANENVWHKDIAKALGHGHKQIYCLCKKLGIKLNTKNPNAFQSSISKVELQVITWLKNAGYEITQQFPLRKFFFDAHIVNTNLLIEVHGDYWHCNPQIYKSGPINDMQRTAIKRDFAKRDQAKQLGFKRLVIWENDIKQNPSETKEKLLIYVKKYINNEKII